MSLLADHRSGNHDEALVSGCKVCDAFLAFFVKYGAVMPSELEQKAIAEAEAEEEVPDDEPEFLREGLPEFNGAFR